MMGKHLRHFGNSAECIEKINNKKKILNTYWYVTRSLPELKKLSLIEHAWDPAVINHPFKENTAVFSNLFRTCKLEGLNEGKILKKGPPNICLGMVSRT